MTNVLDKYCIYREYKVVLLYYTNNYTMYNQL